MVFTVWDTCQFSVRIVALKREIKLNQQQKLYASKVSSLKPRTCNTDTIKINGNSSHI